MRLDEINIRDPFILPYNGLYYMYGTRVGTPTPEAMWGKQTGFDVYVSSDLAEWSEAKSVFELNDAFWGTESFWAPEVHVYNDKFYMFATFKALDRCRATHILVSDHPDGMFVPVSETPITPKDWECLDGTLYVDQKGDPHVVFCHEWLQITDGAICEMKLSDTLSYSVSNPRDLWNASTYRKVRGVGPNGMCYVTDGPFLFRGKSGDLYCIWSTFGENGYAELVSKSSNGEIDGCWRILDEPLFSADGGHGMIFKTFDGTSYFVMHSPNTATMERPMLYEVLEKDGCLSIRK